MKITVACYIETGGAEVISDVFLTVPVQDIIFRGRRWNFCW